MACWHRKKAVEQCPFKHRDGKSGPDPRHNQAGSVPNDADLIDGRYPLLSDRNSNDNGSNTPLPSKGEDSSRGGNDKENFAVAMAPPAKRGKVNDGGLVPCRVCKVIAESDDEDNAEDDDTLMNEVKELLKGEDIDPLAFD